VTLLWKWKLRFMKKVMSLQR